MDTKLSEFKPVVEKLWQISQELIDVIDQQTAAVTAADRQQVEQCVERYSDLKALFEQKEKEFVRKLQFWVGPEDDRTQNLKLAKLKQVFPESTETIDLWRKELEQQTKELKRKHQKLNTLLEFALEQNMDFMRSIYRLHDQKDTHYSSGGDKTEMSSGIAVNKEA